MAKIITRWENLSERLGSGVLTTGQTVDYGMLLMSDAGGNIREANDTVDCKFAGVATRGAGGTNENPKAEFKSGGVFFYSASAAAQTDVGLIAEISGLGTIALTSTQHILVGKIVRCEVGKGWWIDLLVKQ